MAKNNGVLYKLCFIIKDVMYDKIKHMAIKYWTNLSSHAYRRIQYGKIIGHRWAALPIFVFFVFIISIYSCYAAEILYIDVSNRVSVEEQQIDIASEFYGLKVNRLSTSSKDILQQLNSIKFKNVRAAIISADSIPYIDFMQFITSMKKIGIRKILITNVSSFSDDNALRQWSNGAIKGSE